MPEFRVAKRGARIVIIVGEAVLDILLAIGFAAGRVLGVFLGDPHGVAIGDGDAFDPVIVPGAGALSAKPTEATMIILRMIFISTTA